MFTLSGCFFLVIIQFISAHNSLSYNCRSAEPLRNLRCILTRKPRCRRETARCPCKCWSIQSVQELVKSKRTFALSRPVSEVLQLLCSEHPVFQAHSILLEFWGRSISCTKARRRHHCYIHVRIASLNIVVLFYTYIHTAPQYGRDRGQQ